jgi:hypothetical protein
VAMTAASKGSTYIRSEGSIVGVGVTLACVKSDPVSVASLVWAALWPVWPVAVADPLVVAVAKALLGVVAVRVGVDVDVAVRVAVAGADVLAG